ncbi:hypothetical protein [Cytobacillus horneckiae]|uniref:hypothetical protein n=1 Tax=Cytobacillus horneckiae TaxID=549687 RepID=UPI003D9A8220
MTKNYEPRQVFLVLCIATAIFSLILLLFIPQIIADIVHHTSGVWQVFVPKGNFVVYAVGFFLIFLSLFILFILDIKKKSILLSILCILLSIIPFYIGSQSYIIFANDSISYSPIFSAEKKKYTWDELSAVTYFKAKEGEKSEYVFTFKDDNTITLEDNSYFGNIINPLQIKLKEIGIIFNKEGYSSE